MKRVVYTCLLMMMCLVASAQSASTWGVYYNKPAGQLFTATDTFECDSNWGVAFIPQGNCGEYCLLISLEDDGTVLGDTVYVPVGFAFQVVTTGARNGEYIVNLGTLSNIINGADTIAPYVAAIKVKN